MVWDCGLIGDYPDIPHQDALRVSSVISIFPQAGLIFRALVLFGLVAYRCDGFAGGCVGIGRFLGCGNSKRRADGREVGAGRVESTLD